MFVLLMLSIWVMMEHTVLMIQLKAVSSGVCVVLSKLLSAIRPYQIAHRASSEVEEDENREDNDSDTRTFICKNVLGYHLLIL